ncbi:HEPN domain-containing protein [Methylomagnum sp.]
MPLESSPPGSPSRWMRHAASDLLLARSKPAGVLLELLCFHTQQAVEKAIKAMLLAQGIEFPKTHNLRILLELLAERMEIPAQLWSAAGLTEYAVSLRYPGEMEAVTEEEYEAALVLADAVIHWAERVIGNDEAQKR